MSRFQLESSAALFASAVGSCVVRYLTRGKEGKISLPVQAADGDVGDASMGRDDPFDVTTPEDTIDGYPIDIDNFWKQTQRRKLAMLVLLAFAFAVKFSNLYWFTASRDKDCLISLALQLAFCFYLLVFTGQSINQRDVHLHTKTVLHVVTLSTIATAFFGVTWILLNMPPLTISDGHSGGPPALDYALLISYATVCTLAFTTPTGPKLHYPPEKIFTEKTVAAITNTKEDNVSGLAGASVWGHLFFSYTAKLIWLSANAESLNIGDLPILLGNMRSTYNYAKMKMGMREIKLHIGSWKPKPGSGLLLGYRLLRLNGRDLVVVLFLSVVSSMFKYTPAIFLEKLVAHLELDDLQGRLGWGWIYSIGLFLATVIANLISSQLWSLCHAHLTVRIRVQTNSLLFAKTLVRKDVVSLTPHPSKQDEKPGVPERPEEANKQDNKTEFSSKAQIMTLMTSDVGQVSGLSGYLSSLFEAPTGVVLGISFLHHLLGVSCFFGIAVSCLLLPLNGSATRIGIETRQKLMEVRDERVSLMNEILGGIRMLKFMAWERSFEARVLKVREKELRYQKKVFIIENLWSVVWQMSPILAMLVSFWHYTIVRQQILTPSVAFTSITVFSQMRSALNVLPFVLIRISQTLVSLRRVEKYLSSDEIKPVPPLDQQSGVIALRSCTVTWSQDRSMADVAPSAGNTLPQTFVLEDLTLNFPKEELSLVCGRVGSGKTLLLLALLGEADVVAGQLLCPRSPPGFLSSYTQVAISERWIVEGVTAYMPQTAWLRNASIRENILFNLPYDEERYQKTLEACALFPDLAILEDGDESEIGERGINLSGGQKARVSLARAVYSRASILLLDDVLSAVDAHTAHHIYTKCLKGSLMQGRTVILVSHHVQLCAPGAKYIVALDNGRLQFEGNSEAFLASPVMKTLLQSTMTPRLPDEEEEPEQVEAKASKIDRSSGSSSEASSTIASIPVEEKKKRKAPRKFVNEEKRATGRIDRDIWMTYIRALGNAWFWIILTFIFLVDSTGPLAENGWLRYWSASATDSDAKSPAFYITIYALISASGLVSSRILWFVVNEGSIHASVILYKRLLGAVLFTSTRFHDTVSRGRLLNRFGSDFDGIDSSIAENFGQSIMYALSAFIVMITISVVGGPLFILAALGLGVICWNVAKVYSHTSRDMRRLNSTSTSPLYSTYDEAVSGIITIRAFGASSKFLRDMLRCTETNSHAYYWFMGVNRWLNARFELTSAIIVGITGLICLVTPEIDASLAGFTLAFASTITEDLLVLVHYFVRLERALVSLERVQEYSELEREFPEFIEPRPPASWPSHGAIKCEDLVIRYAPDLPNVLHNLNFEIHPGEKVGILGRTGSGKSTLALSFFRFVEPTEGRILIDGLDTSKIGLTDLRSRLTIIPQDPTILSGTLRNTLDVFGEYEDVDIYEALRRVHLIPSTEAPMESAETVNANVFRDLDSAVSEGGENFSTGEKQLLCMARAILKRAKVLIMDEATASVDYATDELIGKTIRQEFSESTILTIAHRLRTVIDYDRVMVLDEGRIAEFDKPSSLLSDHSSKFYALCKATGKEEFALLKKMALVDPNDSVLGI